MPAIRPAKSRTPRKTPTEKVSSRRGPSRPSAATPVTVTRRELADRLTVHPMTVTKWEQAGLPVADRGRKGRPSRYDEAAVRAWLAAREAQAKSSGVNDVALERARKERAQALEAEQRIAIKAKEFVPVADVEKAWTAEVQAVRTAILATYTTKADQMHRIALTEGVAGVEAFLKELAHDLLRELAAGARAEPTAAAPPEQGTAA